MNNYLPQLYNGYTTRGLNRMDRRIFSGIYSTGIVYADRKRDSGGDYARLAFLSFDTLELEIEADCPQGLQQEIIHDAAQVQARKGAAIPNQLGRTTCAAWIARQVSHNR